jgi:deoxyribose-phosphate aldolase
LCLIRVPASVQQVVAAGADRIGAGLGVATVGSAARQMARYIDHTILKPDATEVQIRQLCAEAAQYGFAAVCVNPTWVRLCAELLCNTPVKVCTVVGFPLGATLSEVKTYETRRAIRLGAGEIDMVINIGALKSGDYALVERDIAGVVTACREEGAHSKVIIEAALLTDEEKVQACTLSKSAGADFVKTSTGFASGGATVEDVTLMRRVVGPAIGVKAAGGVRSFNDAEGMVRAGATRIGSSASVKIMQEAAAK